MKTSARKRKKKGTVVRLPRRGGRWRGALRALLVGLIVAGALAGTAVAVLPVREVRVVGAQRLSPDAVLASAQLSGGERILFTRLDRVEDRVRAMPAIRRADVRRELPGTVVIEVVERVALARLDLRKDIAVDADGRLFALPDTAKLPILVGWSGRVRQGAAIDRLSRTILRAYAAFPSGFRERAAAIRLGEELAIDLRGGTRVRMGSAEALGPKAAAAMAILRSAQARGERLAVIDVRAPTAPVSRTVPPPTPVPSPTPAP